MENEEIYEVLLGVFFRPKSYAESLHAKIRENGTYESRLKLKRKQHELHEATIFFWLLSKCWSSELTRRTYFYCRFATSATVFLIAI